MGWKENNAKPKFFRLNQLLTFCYLWVTITRSDGQCVSMNEKEAGQTEESGG